VCIHYRIWVIIWFFLITAILHKRDWGSHCFFSNSCLLYFCLLHT
jgi:hypothetical protein